MDVNNMKNIVILKNLPSNLLEEAIFVVKDKKKAIDLDYLNNAKNLNKGKENAVQGYMNSEDLKKIEKVQKDSRKYVVKEAEMVVNNYLEKMNDFQRIKEKYKLETKYNRMKYLNYILVIIALLSTLICAIK